LAGGKKKKGKGGQYPGEVAHQKFARKKSAISLGRNGPADIIIGKKKKPAEKKKKNIQVLPRCEQAGRKKEKKGGTHQAPQRRVASIKEFVLQKE